MCSAFLGRKLSQSNPLNFFNNGGLTGNIQKAWSLYYEKYIATNSVKPLLHVIGFYSIVGYTTKQSQIHKYVTQSRFH